MAQLTYVDAGTARKDPTTFEATKGPSEVFKKQVNSTIWGLSVYSLFQYENRVFA